MRTSDSPTKRGVVLRVTLVVLAALMVGAALAQAAFPETDIVSLGSSPALAIVFLAGFVSWFRSLPVGSRIDGPVGVGGFTVITGVIMGVLLQVADLLTVPWFEAFTSPVGGLLYGVFIGADAVFGMSVTLYLINKFGGAKAPTAFTFVSPEGASVQLSEGNINSLMGVSDVAGYVLHLVRDRFGDNVPAIVWDVMASLLKEFPRATLNENVRGEIQARFLALLRKAGLKGKDL